MSTRNRDACKGTINLHFLIPLRTKKWGDGRAVVFGVFWVGFFVVYLASTYMRSTIFYLLQTSGRLKLPSAYHLAGESSKIFSGQTLSYIIFPVK